MTANLKGLLPPPPGFVSDCPPLVGAGSPVRLLTWDTIRRVAASGKLDGVARYGRLFHDVQRHNNCAGNSASCILAKAIYDQRGDKVVLSGTYTYSLINGGHDSGAMLADAMRSIERDGVPLAKTVGSDAIFPHLYDRHKAAAEAQRFKARECYAIRPRDFTDADELQRAVWTALALGFKVGVAIQAGSRFDQLDRYGICGVDSGAGNHAVHCCLPSSRIASRRMKTADSVNIGDMVYGHDGREHRVSGVARRYFNGDLIRIQAEGTHPIEVTSEHPLLVYRLMTHEMAAVECTHGAVGRAHLPKFTTLGDRRYTPVWVKAEAVRKTDRIVIPSITLDDVSADGEWEFFVGYYAGNGSLIVDKDRGVRGVNIDLPISGPIARINAVLSTWGNVRMIWRGTNGAIVSEDAATSVRLSMLSTSFGHRMRSLVGRRSHEKRLPFITESVLSGLLAADGCVCNGYVHYSTVSDVLSQQVLLAAVSLGYEATRNLVAPTKSQFANAKPYWRIRWKQCPAKPGKRPADNAMLRTVTSVLAIPYSGEVFNFEVDDVHSFIVDTVATHNCDGLKMANGVIVATAENTWPLSWGDNGRMKLHWGHFRETIGVHEFYAIRDVTDDPLGSKPPEVQP